MAEPRTFVIAGGGLCGATAAATLREEGFDGRLVVSGEESLPPYERPPLSKEYLRGEQDLEAALVRPLSWFDEHEVETRFGDPVVALDPGASTVTTRSGEHISYDRLLLATGVRNRRLEAPGIELPDIFELRSVPDADAIRAAVAGASGALIVGMGFIGAEVAASLRTLGVAVTIVEIFDTALVRALGAEDGRTIEAIHRDHGVRMLFGESIARFEGAGRFESAVTASGERIEADVAIVGVGTIPNTELAVAAGLEVGPNHGIAVDERLRTGAPGVFAAGDVADHDHPLFGRIRVEHYDNAIKMGVTAARNMLGAELVHDDPHWFWSDQYDTNLQVAGYATSWDDRVVRGHPENRAYAAFYLQDGVVRQVVTIDHARDARRSLKLIAAAARPDPASLADPAVDLRTLLAEAGG